ncbi:MAG: hypothetical protein K2X47_19640 [Bdellovibrionales bacterium]|nr:hypothetical protein [Bdellovibrionales bacterium]
MMKYIFLCIFFFIKALPALGCEFLPPTNLDFDQKNPVILDSKSAVESKFDIALTAAVRLQVSPRELAIRVRDYEFWNPLLKQKVVLAPLGSFAAYRAVVDTPTGNKFVLFERNLETQDPLSQFFRGFSYDPSKPESRQQMPDVILCTKVSAGPSSQSAILILNVKIKLLSLASRMSKPLVSRQVAKIIGSAFGQILLESEKASLP